MKRPTGPILLERRTLGGALRALFGFVVVSVLAGLFATLGVAPAIALTGFGTSGTIGLFESLPSYLDVGRLMQKTDIYAGDPEDPQLLASFYDQNRIEVAGDQIATTVKDAVVASEDPRFFDHGGIDLQGTIRAITSTYVLGAEVQGGSSITQQYVKNVLVQKAESISDPTARQAAYEEATATTPKRKVAEMSLAIGLEKRFSKEDILLGYLNIALFGGTVYGIEAAANYYYGVHASELSLDEAAALIAIVNNPEKFRFDLADSETNGAANGYAVTRERRDYILDRMLEFGHITAAEHDAAITEEISPTITQPSTGCQTAGNAAYFCDYVTQVLRSDPALGATEDDRYAALKRGGLQVYTTLDVDIQNTAQETMDELVPKVDPRFDLGAATVSVQADTGRVLMMVQNKDYSQDPTVIATGANYSAINFNVDKAMGGGLGFQTGSTYKVFTLAEWLNAGHTLVERFDSKRKNWDDFTDSCNGTWKADPADPFNPQNSTPDDDADTLDPITSTVNSINTGYIGMAHELDLCAIRRTAEAFGIHTGDGSELGQSPATVLGTNGIAPLTMAVAYAGIANDGVTCTAIAIDSIVDADGTAITPPASSCTRSVSTAVAHGMQYAMQQVLLQGTGTMSNPNDGVQHIAKTGTTDNSSDIWTVGASSKASLAFWLGNVAPVNGVKTNMAFLTFDYGPIDIARHYVWKPIMTALDAKYGGSDFAAPDASALQTPMVTVPDLAGLSVADATTELTALGLIPGDQNPTPASSAVGSVSNTAPAAGESVAKGTSVLIGISTGPAATATPAPAP
ncbi:transglycosylase domain-containing protein [Microbacteriaceae bacterium VKM Ac-2855]|nr:transglycosylase domain-containing protein [Microbacteriaceae bacterium VKM Ac-2855]